VGNYKDTVTKRVSLGVRSSTKNKLDKNRAPGQCYDGFITQLVDLWETTKIEAAKKSKG
jgi:hypothetical protein